MRCASVRGFTATAFAPVSATCFQDCPLEFTSAACFHEGPLATFELVGPPCFHDGALLELAGRDCFQDCCDGGDRCGVGGVAANAADALVAALLCPSLDLAAALIPLPASPPPPVLLPPLAPAAEPAPLPLGAPALASCPFRPGAGTLPIPFPALAVVAAVVVEPTASCLPGPDMPPRAGDWCSPARTAPGPEEAVEGAGAADGADDWYAAGSPTGGDPLGFGPLHDG